MKMSRRTRTAGVAALAAAVVGAWGWYAYRDAAGEPRAELAEGWNEGHRIVARDGSLLREMPSEIGVRGRAVSLEEIGDRLVVCTLAAEDRRFFEHSGVDPAAILRALGQNLRALEVVSGASTITQQLVKLLDSSGRPEASQRTAGVKLREAARAQNLEEQLDKRQILEAYLNRLNYGRNLVGPAAAAQAYFGVSPRDLSWAQAAFLAVLPRAPSYLDPYKHRERGVKRQRLLLASLRDHAVLTAADHERSAVEPLELRAIEHAFEAPHLVASLAAGALGGLAPGAVTETTVDLELQHDVEGLLETHGPRLDEAHASGAAVVVVDNDSGEVLAYVGGPRFGGGDGEMIDMARSPRQPGSALKPFVYALAFAHGLQPSEMVADVPTSFGESGGTYAPGNFDLSFHGPVSAREALAGSLNVPAVRLAAGLPGGELLGLLRGLGMTSLDRDASFYGLSLALGSGEVTLLELAGAYATVARGGRRAPLHVTRHAARDAEEELLDPAVAAAVADSLSDPLARVRGLGGSGPFDVGFPVAVKTGTSSGFRDSWTVGFTRERTVAVWVGNPDGGATAELNGGAGAGPVFADVMRRAMAAVPTRQPLYAEGLLETVAVCPLSGKRPGPACGETTERRLIPHAGGEETCTVHRRAARAGQAWRCDARGPGRIVVLPEPFDAWLASQPPGAPGRDPFGLPWLSASQLPSCSDVAVASLRIDEPPSGAVLYAAEGSSIELSASLLGPASPTTPIEFVLDGAVVATSSGPYRAHVDATPGDHILLVRPVDPRSEMVLGRSEFSVR
jgi:penicillin-binding protein 1C